MKKMLITLLAFVLFGCFLPTFSYADAESEREHCRILILNVAFAETLQKKCGYACTLSRDKREQISVSCLPKLAISPKLLKENPPMTEELKKEIIENVNAIANDAVRRGEQAFETLLENFKGDSERACRAGLNLSNGWVEDRSNTVIIQRR